MDAAITLLPFILLSIVLVLANLEAYSPAFRWLTILSLVTLNSLLVLFGLAGMAMPAGTIPGMPEEATAAYQFLVIGVGVTGVIAFMPLLPPVRRLLARIMPIDPEPAVTITALVYAVYLVGTGLSQQPILTNAEALEFMDFQVTSGLAWAQGVGMVLLALSGLGLFTRRSPREVIVRLGLEPLTLQQFGVAAAGVVGLLGLQVGVTLLWQQVDPAGFAALDAASNVLFGEFTGFWAALTIGLTAALGEELVFRGALQPRFGLLITALLFTIIHSQYGFSPATGLVLLIALLLGWLRQRYNLNVPILVHFGYNFLSVLVLASI